ncbi:MAG: enoyl-CoA hydratase-related protein [Thermaerobacter sp.]|nr:enoyl-CoA hydratase/isomerase family protein [Bacillota bacterium]
MAYRHLLVERDGGIGRIVINRPEVRNALNQAACAELVRAFAELSADPEVRVILLRGAGREAFCAGADLKELTGREGVLERRGYFSGVADVLRQMARTEPPIVAMVHGYALAGGCGLAAACDLVYAADDAVFGVPELHVGLFPMVVMAPILRSVGRKRGLELFFRGHRISGREALELGLVTRVFPADRLEDETEAVLAGIARFSPALLRLGRQAFQRSDGLSYLQALDYLQEMIAVAAMTEDAREGTTAFVERRQPHWRGR